MSTPPPGQIWTRLFSAYDSWADAAADALGVNRTDLACLRALYANGPMTAGALAETVVLTTGAITGILDRLERSGFIHRESDPQDRRRVLAAISAERAGALATMFAVLEGESSSDGVFTELEHQTSLLSEHAARLRGSARSAALEPNPGGHLVIPLGATRRASLELVGGVMDVRTSADATLTDLARVRVGGPSIKVTERDGNVRLASRLRFLARRESAELQLNPSVPWALRMSGGRNHASFDLRALSVPTVDVVGGDGEVEYSFGSLASPTVIKVEGGASAFVVHHTPSTPVEVSVRGILSLSVDGEDLGRQLNSTWRSGGAGAPGIQLLVNGGLNKVVLITDSQSDRAETVPNE